MTGDREDVLSTLAVIVVNYGSSELLRETLVPLHRALPASRVVVVDNFTSTEEVLAVRALAAEHGFLLHEEAVNVGFGRGMNAGADLATRAGARSLLLLNPDATIGADEVASLVEAVRDDPTALVSPTIRRPDGTTWFGGSWLSLDDGRTGARFAPGGAVDPARAVPWITGACLAVDAGFFERLGGFDDDYFLYWEDVDLSWRVGEAGGSLRVLPDVVAVHAQGGTQSGGGATTAGSARSNPYYFYNIRNRLLFASRHLDTPDLERWMRTAVPTAWEVLMRGGRRQLLTSPSSLVAAARGVRAGRRLARAELRRRRATAP